MNIRFGRFFLTILMLLTLVGRAWAQGSDVPLYVGFDHLTLEVNDVARSADFYSRVFGAEVWQSGDENYLVLGKSYLRLRRNDPPRVAQMGLGVQNYTPSTLQGYLEREALRWQAEAGDAALWVEDRDGVRSFLLPADSWAQVSAKATRQSAATDAIFKPLHLDEIGLSVTNLEVDSLFYARLLGRTGVLQAGALWFDFGNSRLRLSQTPVGQKPGVSYFSILIANTELEEAANAVFAAGGIIETLLPNGFSFWDPDGLRVEVHTTPML